MINIFLPRLISTAVLNLLPKAIINVVVELPPSLPILTFTFCKRSGCKMWVQNKPTNVNHFQSTLLNSIRSCYRNDTIFNGMEIPYCNMTFNLYKNSNIDHISWNHSISSIILEKQKY